MSTSSVERDVAVTTDHDRPHGARTVTNWVLAGLALVGAFAVVGFAYLRVLGTAACTDSACGGVGPSELVFSLILYGTPIVAVVGVIVSFLTARHRWGIAVPVASWAAVAIALIILLVTF
jgi:hypothetical protein